MAPAAPPLLRLLFVHGMWSTAAVWDAWRPRFEARGFATEALSLPGHGGDSDRLDGLGLEECVRAVEQAIERRPGPVALIGHSMGGLLCQQVAARRPLAALVLVCSAAPAPVFPQRPAMWPALLHHFMRWGSWRGQFRLSRREADALLLNAVPAPARAALFAGMQAESGRLAWQASFGTLNWSGSNRVDASAIRCPMLALAGLQDRIVPPGVSRALARLYGKRLDYREHAQHGHWPLAAEQGWQQRADEVADWLLTHTSKGAAQP